MFEVSRLALAGLLVALGACTSVPSATQADLEQEEAVLRALKSDTWPGLYAANDADGLAAFLADDFVLIGGGVRTRADEVNWMRENSVSSASAKLRTISVFASPGTPSSKICPPESRPINKREIIASWPTNTLPTSPTRSRTTFDCS